MTRHRSHSTAVKRQVAEEFIAGETQHALSKRHDISRQLIRIWVSDVEITDRHSRRLAALQGFISFVFNNVLASSGHAVDAVSKRGSVAIYRSRFSSAISRRQVATCEPANRVFATSTTAVRPLH